MEVLKQLKESAGSAATLLGFVGIIGGVAAYGTTLKNQFDLAQTKILQLEAQVSTLTDQLSRSNSQSALERGEPGKDAREMELRATVSHIQWRYVGETWRDLLPIADIIGPKGATGDRGDAGPRGEQGPKGERGERGPAGQPSSSPPNASSPNPPEDLSRPPAPVFDELRLDIHRSHNISKYGVSFIVEQLFSGFALVRIDGDRVRMNYGVPTALKEGERNCTATISDSTHNGSAHAARGGQVTLQVGCR